MPFKISLAKRDKDHRSDVTGEAMGDTFHRVRHPSGRPLGEKPFVVAEMHPHFARRALDKELTIEEITAEQAAELEAQEKKDAEALAAKRAEEAKKAEGARPAAPAPLAPPAPKPAPAPTSNPTTQEK